MRKTKENCGQSLWIYLIVSNSKNILIKIFLILLGIDVIFANGIKSSGNMRIAISGQSIVFLKHRGTVNLFYGGTGTKNKTEEITIKIQENQEITEAKENFVEEKEEVKEKKPLKMNKKKFRKKAEAFANLEESKKFIGFYSISFPKGLDDMSCKRCLNTWLTKLREKYKLSNYMWVAERQKNKTLHFHLLTNQKMPIKAVNAEMAKTIQYVLEKSQLNSINYDRERYNGVDLAYAGKRNSFNDQKKPKKEQTKENRIKFIARYMSKYMSKENEGWPFLPCHYSRSISALATGFVLDYIEQIWTEKELIPNSSIAYYYNSEYYEIVILEEFLPETLLKRFYNHNQKVYLEAQRRLKNAA